MNSRQKRELEGADDAIETGLRDIKSIIGQLEDELNDAEREIENLKKYIEELKSQSA